MDAVSSATSSYSRSTGVDYGNTVFVDSSESGTDISAEDFLQLMVAQLANQDFMNPVDDTQYLSQLAQFSTMQAMTELSEYSQQNYVRSLVGQNVTAARYKVNGEIEAETGIIEKIELMNNDYVIYVNGKSFSLEQIMSINANDTNSNWGGGTSNMLSLIGQQVTVKDEKLDEEITGVVEKISMSDGMKLYVNGEWYTLDQLVSVDGKPEEDETSPPEEGGEDTETTPEEGTENA